MTEPTFLQKLATNNSSADVIASIQKSNSARQARLKKTNAALLGLLNDPDVRPTPAGIGKGGRGYGGSATVAGGPGKRGKIIDEAQKYLGRMYQWGGSNPSTSFDCSGLVQWAYKKVGISLPRVSAQQARSGRRVPINQLKQGDLVAWDNSSRNVGADHIAIYIGGGKIIEAAKRGTAIRVRNLGKGEGAWGVQIMKR